MRQFVSRMTTVRLTLSFFCHYGGNLKFLLKKLHLFRKNYVLLHGFCGYVTKYKIMVTSFSVENYRSIDERINLSLEASMGIKDMDNRGYSTVANARVLNAMAFYGANSSGKTNIFKAVGRMRSIIIQSVRLNDGEKLPYEPFLLSDQPMHPTLFEMSFAAGTDKYCYGFSYTAERIVEEWLIAKYPKRSLKTLFRRTPEAIQIDEDNFSEGITIKSGNVPLNENRLFISLAAQLGGEVSKRVIEWFRTRLNVVSGIRDDYFARVTKEMIHSESDYKDEILKFIGSLDLGFNEVTTKQENIDEMTLPKGFPAELIASLKEHPIITAYAKHQKYNAEGEVVGTVDFDIDEMESDGTKKLFNLAGPIVDTLKKGKTLFIDEMDAQLHPLLSRELVNLFNCPETNPNGAQLVFTTHDTNMLSKKLLRRDQIVFVEKEHQLKMTHLIPMMTITLENGAKPRTDSNYEKNYLEGKYGAIPDLQSIIDGSINE